MVGAQKPLTSLICGMFLLEACCFALPGQLKGSALSKIDSLIDDDQIRDCCYQRSAKSERPRFG